MTFDQCLKISRFFKKVQIRKLLIKYDLIILSDHHLQVQIRAVGIILPKTSLSAGQVLWERIICMLSKNCMLRKHTLALGKAFFKSFSLIDLFSSHLVMIIIIYAPSTRGGKINIIVIIIVPVYIIIMYS